MEMNYFDKELYQVIALHELPHADWDSLLERFPLLPRGWFELSRLSIEDRIEFTHDYWCSQLLSTATRESALARRLAEFFESLEEIGFFATQATAEHPFEFHMVYSQKGNIGFFQGNPPASKQAIETFQKSFGHIVFPPDYLAFLRIHDGFSKYTDTGLIKMRDMAKTYQKLQKLLFQEDQVSCSAIIPFYESSELHCYQCFYADGFSNEEMDNFFFSKNDRATHSLIHSQLCEESCTFSSFLEWLIFYLDE